MKVIFKIFVCAVMIAAAVIFSSMALSSNGNSAQPAEAASDAAYILREWNGYIGIFYANDLKKPFSVTDIQIATLRENDRQMLSVGIEADTQEQLMRLLEDYGS